MPMGSTQMHQYCLCAGHHLQGQTQLGTHDAVEPVFPTAVDACLIAPLSNLPEAVSWHIAKQWSTRPLGVGWALPDGSAVRRCTNVPGLIEERNFAVLAGHTIRVHSYEAMLVRVATGMEFTQQAAVVPFNPSKHFVCTGLGSSLNVYAAESYRQNVHVRWKLLRAAGFSAGRLHAQETSDPGGAMAQSIPQEKCITEDISADGAAGRLMRCSRLTTVGVMSTGAGISTGLRRWRITSQNTQLQSEEHVQGSPQNGDDVVQAGSSSYESTKNATRTRKRKVTREPAEPQPKRAKTLKSTAQQQQEIMDREEPGTFKYSGGRDRRHERQHACVAHKASESINGWTPRQLETTHRKQPEANVHQVLSSVCFNLCKLLL